jgi:hypothetical protein
MMRSRLSIVLAVLPFILFGQSYEDALRYSVFQPYGSARFHALGGAFTALGGDISAGVLNPASSAVYNQDDISIGMGIVSNLSEGPFLTDESNRSNFVFTNMGGVFKIDDQRNRTNERNWSFSIALNRIADFNEWTKADLYYDESSLIDWFLEGAQGIEYNYLNPFSDYLAWDAYVIDTLGGPTSYIGAISEPGQRIRQDVKRSGGITDMGFQVAKRYSHKLMFGFGIHLPILRYREQMTYSEQDFLDSNSYLSSFVYQTELKADGLGINVKAGLIYRPVHWFRLGIAVHSPTWYGITEYYTSELSATYGDDSEYETYSPNGEFLYNLQTPARLILGTAYVLGPFALISVEYEWLDYGMSRLRSESYNYSDENREIKENLGSTGMLRAGFEWRVDHFSLRAGYGSMGNPLNYDSGFEQQMWSVGLAFRGSLTYFDISFSQNSTRTQMELYALENGQSPTAMVDNSKYYLISTIGWKF